MMRNQLSKLKKTTKDERRLSEIFKKNHIRFKAQVRIGKYCVDFLIGRVVLEVDGSVHQQINSEKDKYLFGQGYVPLHIKVGEYNEDIEKEILCLIKNNNL